MIEVKEVLGRKDQREFLNFPLDLYKGNDCFIPPLWMDEAKIFRGSAASLSSYLRKLPQNQWGKWRLRSITVSPN